MCRMKHKSMQRKRKTVLKRAVKTQVSIVNEHATNAPMYNIVVCRSVGVLYSRKVLRHSSN